MSILPCARLLSVCLSCPLLWFTGFTGQEDQGEEIIVWIAGPGGALQERANKWLYYGPLSDPSISARHAQ